MLNAVKVPKVSKSLVNLIIVIFILFLLRILIDRFAFYHATFNDNTDFVLQTRIFRLLLEIFARTFYIIFLVMLYEELKYNMVRFKWFHPVFIGLIGFYIFSAVIFLIMNYLLVYMNYDEALAFLGVLSLISNVAVVLRFIIIILGFMTIFRKLYPELINIGLLFIIIRLLMLLTNIIFGIAGEISVTSFFIATIYSIMVLSAYFITACVVYKISQPSEPTALES